MGGQQHHLHGRIEPFGRGQYLDAVEPRHPQVRQDQPGAFPFDDLDRPGGVTFRQALVRYAAQDAPAIVQRILFVVDDQARLLCLARSTGKVRWVSKLPRWKNEKKKSGAIVWTSPVLAGDRLILASSEGDLVNVDPTTGAIQSQTEAGDSVSLPLVVAGRTLLVLSSDGRLTAWR